MQEDGPLRGGANDRLRRSANGVGVGKMEVAETEGFEPSIPGMGMVP